MSLSIIIPTLNEEKYVGKLLDCLVNQTYKDFEVIVVDGHSDDKTKKVVRNYIKRLDLKITKAKKGVIPEECWCGRLVEFNLGFGLYNLGIL